MPQEFEKMEGEGREQWLKRDRNWKKRGNWSNKEGKIGNNATYFKILGISITLIAKIRFEEGYCEREPETEVDTKKESQTQR